MMVDLCRWLILMVADADERWFADRWEDHDGVPIA